MTLLQRVTDNDMDQPVGSAIYTQFLNANGGIESDLTITRLGEDYFRAVTGSGFIAADLGWLRMHSEPGDPPVEIRDVTMEWSCLALWGPRARQVLEKITPADISNDSFPYLHAAYIDIRGFQVFAQRVSYVGELGWELYIDPERAVQVWDAIMEAGQEFGIEVGGYKVLDSLRVEKGYKYFTADITPMEDPFSAGLGFCVKLNKGEFIGRQALQKIKTDGTKKKLCTLTLEGEDYLPIYGGEAIYLDGKVISRVRSGGYGYTLNRNIIYAYLPNELAKPGTGFEVDVFEKRVPAEVTAPVLIDPKGERLRA